MCRRASVLMNSMYVVECTWEQPVYTRVGVRLAHPQHLQDNQSTVPCLPPHSWAPRERQVFWGRNSRLISSRLLSPSSFSLSFLPYMPHTFLPSLSLSSSLTSLYPYCQLPLVYIFHNSIFLTSSFLALIVTLGYVRACLRSLCCYFVPTEVHRKLHQIKYRQFWISYDAEKPYISIILCVKRIW